MATATAAIQQLELTPLVLNNSWRENFNNTLSDSPRSLRDEEFFTPINSVKNQELSISISNELTDYINDMVDRDNLELGIEISKHIDTPRPKRLYNMIAGIISDINLNRSYSINNNIGIQHDILPEDNRYIVNNEETTRS